MRKCRWHNLFSNLPTIAANIRATAKMTDPHNLQRFIDAQDPVYSEVLAELAAGQKTSHWMWFVFPQHKDLGRSAMAQHYGIASKEEALVDVNYPDRSATTILAGGSGE